MKGHRESSRPGIRASAVGSPTESVRDLAKGKESEELALLEAELKRAGGFQSGQLADAESIHRVALGVENVLNKDATYFLRTPADAPLAPAALPPQASYHATADTRIPSAPPAGVSAKQEGAPGRTLGEAVPVLVRGVRQEKNLDLQVRCGETLARMGPLAWKAVPALTETLRNTNDPRQQQVVVNVLRQLGPAARSAAPLLENLASDGTVEVRRDAGVALRTICVPAWVGVKDTAQVLGERTRARVNARSLDLSRKHHFQFVAETVRSLPNGRDRIRPVVNDGTQQALSELACKRCQEAGAERDLFVLICKDPPTVHVTLGQDARAKASPRLTEQAVCELLESYVWRNDEDSGLEAAVRFVEQTLVPGK